MNELDLIKEHFDEEIHSEVLGLYSLSALFNDANGISAARQILNSCRIYDYDQPSLYYLLRAFMQAGKTRSALTMLIYLLKHTGESHNVLYWICSSDNALREKTIEETKAQFKQFEIIDDNFILIDDMSDNQISIFYDNVPMTITIIHNAQSKKEISDICTNFKEKSLDKQIIIWDECDQAFGEGSARHQFLKELLGCKNVYHGENASIQRQSLNLYEIQISATPFANDVEHSQEKLNSRTKTLIFLCHPYYYGCTRILEDGHLRESVKLIEKEVVPEAVEAFCKTALEPWVTNNTGQFIQADRPFAFVRVHKGNEKRNDLFSKIKRYSTVQVGIAETKQAVMAKMKDDFSKLILVPFNNKLLTRKELKQIFNTVENANKIQHFKKEYQNFYDMKKKILWVICGTFKEGDDVIGKNSNHISFFWDNPPTDKSTYESPLQSIGRCCKIPFGEQDYIPPLVFSDSDLPRVISDYHTENRLPESHRIRRGSGAASTQSSVVALTYFYGDQCLESAKALWQNFCDKYGYTNDRKSGSILPDVYLTRYASDKHGDSYQQSIYPVWDSLNNNKQEFLMSSDVPDGYTLGDLKKSKKYRNVIYYGKHNNEFLAIHVLTVSSMEYKAIKVLNKMKQGGFIPNTEIAVMRKDKEHRKLSKTKLTLVSG